jgi:hypothetical protein
MVTAFVRAALFNGHGTRGPFDNAESLGIAPVIRAYRARVYVSEIPATRTGRDGGPGFLNRIAQQDSLVSRRGQYMEGEALSGSLSDTRQPTKSFNQALNRRRVKNHLQTRRLPQEFVRGLLSILPISLAA